MPDEGDHSIIETLQIKFVNNLSSACPNIELGIANNHCYYDPQVVHNDDRFKCVTVETACM